MKGIYNRPVVLISVCFLTGFMASKGMKVHDIAFVLSALGNVGLTAYIVSKARSNQDKID